MIEPWATESEALEKTAAIVGANIDSFGKGAAQLKTETARQIRKVRIWLALFIAGLVLSGLTAFPLQRETGLLNRTFGVAASPSTSEPVLHVWLRRVHEGIVHTNRDYPFMAYGTDWLAFAHLVIAVAFLGPLIDPVRNKWVLVFGVVACLGVVPLALIAGPIRGIPFYWRLIDCSFGVIGVVPLLICLRYVRRIEQTT